MKERSRKVLPAVVVLLVLVGIVFFRHGGGMVDVDSGSREVMGTFARIVAVAADEREGRAAIEAGFSEIERINCMMSDYKEDSELSMVNREAFSGPVAVSDELFELLERAVGFSEQSGGAFDVTVGPLVDLYRQAGEEQRNPTKDEIEEAKERVGFDKLLLDGEKKTVKFAVNGMRLDLGAIAKGYAIDLAVEAMKREGAIGGMVDIGGDLRCFGAAPAGKSKWRIGLQDPDVAEDDISGQKVLVVLELGDAAVATSGDYRRFVLIDGEKYSHIVRPQSGVSAGEFSSVTVICDNAADADALATAVSVMGREKGLELVETRAGTEAILIMGGPEFERTQTRGAAKFIK